MALRFCRPLTVKLRGRTSTPDQRGGRTISSGARGAKPQARHGPLQRLLGISQLPSGRVDISYAGADGSLVFSLQRPGREAI